MAEILTQIEAEEAARRTVYVHCISFANDVQGAHGYVTVFGWCSGGAGCVSPGDRPQPSFPGPQARCVVEGRGLRSASASIRTVKP
jgi:hypothetical protein